MRWLRGALQLRMQLGDASTARKSAHTTVFMRFEMAPRDGFEPPTNGLTVRRSTTELPGNSEEARIVGKGAVQVKDVKPAFIDGRRRRAAHTVPRAAQVRTRV